jgi:TonB family protein
MIRASTLDRALSIDELGAGVVPSSHLDDAGAKPAALIAPAPLPRFPAELRSHWSESEVVVRFRVDERGRVDVASLKVLKSDHELFAAAVREVLPRFRFEPARSAAPESKPIADWVDFRVRFAATK